MDGDGSLTDSPSGAASLASGGPPAEPVPWHVFRSTAGRYWATRACEFATGIDAWRTVDADGTLELYRAIAEQESRAVLPAAVE
jgi:hypothetical protein